MQGSHVHTHAGAHAMTGWLVIVFALYLYTPLFSTHSLWACEIFSYCHNHLRKYDIHNAKN